MAGHGFAGLDTPRTNAGDATYLSTQQPQFDMSQEVSFQSPSKDPNIFQKHKNGSRANLRTPRGKSRSALTDRRNLPVGIGGPEFTPMLKSATRNSARRHSGKKNGLKTPAFLQKIDEDSTPIAGVNMSTFNANNASTFLEATPLPQLDTSSVASTPMVMKTRDANANAKGPLQDGNQLSLREQENVIDRIEKENFGLKLKIHFLEEALRKAGPGFSEATLKENTDLKVDRVTMQRELQRYKKTLTSAEKDLEAYRQQMTSMHDKVKQKYAAQASQDQQQEVERLRKELADKDADIQDLTRQLEEEQRIADKVEKLQDDIADLEAEGREKDRIISQHEDDFEDLKLNHSSTQDRLKDAQRRIIELEEKAQSSEKLEEAKDTIGDLEADVRRLEGEVENLKDKLEDAAAGQKRAQHDLEELQDEMANKSVVTKGLSRQVEEKITRLQDEVENARQDYAQLEEQHASRGRDVEDLKLRLKESRQARDTSERETREVVAKLDNVQAELKTLRDQKSLLQTRHDALTNESASLQGDLSRLQKELSRVEEDLEQERKHALDIERNVRDDFKDEIDRLNDDISDLQAEIREKDNLYDNDSEKWETERRKLESDKDLAEQRAIGLQKTIDKLREVEGALSGKESKMQEAINLESQRHKKEEAVFKRQIEDLRQDLEARQSMLEALRSELSAVRDELRQSQLDFQAVEEKATLLEDEVEVLSASLDEAAEKATQEKDSMKRQCDDLKKELAAARAAANNVRASSTASQEIVKLNGEQLNRVQSQLADSNATSTKLAQEKQVLQSQLADSMANATKIGRENQKLHDQLAAVNIKLRDLQANIAEVSAERDELEEEIRELKKQDDTIHDTVHRDQERVNLRTAKTKLESEVRRLKEENKSLLEQRDEIEKTLEEEIEKAAEEEERLGDELRQLRAKIHSSSESQDLVAARRTIRDLERRIQDYEMKLATANNLTLNGDEGNSELSILRHDLNDARQKERDYFQRDAAQKEQVKTLKRQVSMNERRIEDLEAQLAATTPFPSSSPARNDEIAIMRRDLTAARQKERDLVQREAAQKETVKALRRQITELEREVHEAEINRLNVSTHSETNSATKSEISELRHQLTAAHKTINELKRSLRDAQRNSSTALEMEARVEDAEEQKNVLEHALYEARAEIVKSQRSVQELKISLQEAEQHQGASDTTTMLHVRIEEMEDQQVVLERALDEAQGAAAAAQESLQELKNQIRDRETRNAAHKELQIRIEEMEEQKLSLEDALNEAQKEADNVSERHQAAIEKYKTRVDRYRRERDEFAVSLRVSQSALFEAEKNVKALQQTRSHNNMMRNNRAPSESSTQTSSGSGPADSETVTNTVDSGYTRTERQDLHSMLRRTQLEADNLEKELAEHKDALKEVAKIEESLRKKLEKARSERASFRADAERLRADIESLQQSRDDAARSHSEHSERLRREVAELQNAVRNIEMARNTTRNSTKNTTTAPVAPAARFMPPKPTAVTQTITDSLFIPNSSQLEPQPRVSSAPVPITSAKSNPSANSATPFDIIASAGAGRHFHTAALHSHAASSFTRAAAAAISNGETTTVILTVEDATARYEKDLATMALQIRWMQACWEREAKLRSDAAYAKQYLEMQLRFREACNKADIALLRTILTKLHIPNADSLTINCSLDHTTLTPTPTARLRRLTTVLRFIARTRIAARQWRAADAMRGQLKETLEAARAKEQRRIVRREMRAEIVKEVEMREQVEARRTVQGQVQGLMARVGGIKGWERGRIEDVKDVMAGVDVAEGLRRELEALAGRWNGQRVAA